MDDTSELDRVIEEYHGADRAIIRGDSGPYKTLYSHRPDATLANPFGGVWRGWDEISPALDRAASAYREGELTTEQVAMHATQDLAYLVEIERITAKLPGSEDVAEVALRTTSVLRREEGGWKVSHRHADPRVAMQPAESAPTILRS